MAIVIEIEPEAAQGVEAPAAMAEDHIENEVTVTAAVVVEVGGRKVRKLLWKS